MITGFTSGCFDLIHYGHLKYLERCSNLCDCLIVGVDSDKMVKQFKGPLRPIIPEAERLELINSLALVDRAVLVHNLMDLTRWSYSLSVDKVFKHEAISTWIKSMASMTLKLSWS